MFTSRCANCGSTTASRSARREGRLWFCSQSCFLQVESRANRPRRPRRSPLRILGKAIKWYLILIVLTGVTAGAAGFVVGFLDAGFALNDSYQRAERAKAGFPRVKYRMTKARVRDLLGAPEEIDVVAGDLCWYYSGSLAPGYEVCFRRGRLISKLRY